MERSYREKPSQKCRLSMCNHVSGVRLARKGIEMTRELILYHLIVINIMTILVYGIDK